MSTMLFAASVLLAALCAGVMGFAIQRGGTCMVAAVDELLSQGRGRRLLAMGEAALWVGGVLALATLARHPAAMPPGYPASAWVAAGGVLLGLGAWLAGACVFGAIARFGSGEWHYAATPAGFFLGCASVDALFGPVAREALDAPSPVLQAPGVVAFLFAAFVAWRMAPTLRDALARPLRQLPRRLAQRVWSPHAATAVIGITFVAILLAVGVWAYTDVLAQLARGVTLRLAPGALLLAALYLGAVLGGWTAGRLRRPRVQWGGLVRCFAGGALMGWGSLLIPGSNDGLILVGLPLLRPYAWLALASMGLAIALAILTARRLAGVLPGRSAT